MVSLAHDVKSDSRSPSVKVKLHENPGHGVIWGVFGGLGFLFGGLVFEGSPFLTAVLLLLFVSVG